MSLPVEVDWILLKLEDTPSSGTYTLICGIEDVTINGGVNTTDRFVRDCATPGGVPYRKTKVTGRQLDISGSGLSNTQEITRINAALGALRNYKAELYREGPTDAGVLLGTYAGEFRMTSSNLSGPRNADSSAEIALASNGVWTYTDASGS